MSVSVNHMVAEKSEFEVSVATGRPLADTLNALTEALKARGYGVLGTIDVRKTLQEKTGRDVGGFTILDVCSPVHALKVIEKTDRADLVLPCKVSLRNDGRETRISMLKPGRVFGLAGASGLENLADQVETEITGAMLAAGGE